MKNVVVAGVAVLVPSALIGARLFTQAWALMGPSGGSATLEGDRLLLSSKVGARLVELRVEEGDEVHEGDLLARLDCAEPQAALAEAKARLDAAAAQADAALAQAEAAGAQKAVAAAASQAAGAQAEALEAQRDLAARQAERVAALDDDASVASIDQSSSSAQALGHQSLAAEAQARAARLQVGLAKGQAAAAIAQARAAAEQVHAVEAGVLRAELMVAECEVKAPRDATVETLPFEVGELVGPGMPVATLVDLHEVRATFYLPNAELGAAVVGGPATLVADAWPDETFQGKVARVSSEAAFTPRNVQTRTDRDRLVYGVEVVVENPDRKLRPGMPVEVTLTGTDR
ncbi:MAG: HlyD family efflux transporter periplasmic adaptor subunit [Alphaproteobacteria bacterium]|nr:HlyD family efflux transporter periplasmic adaptor subunit [Alphaproteobacteria bacterium]